MPAPVAVPAPVEAPAPIEAPVPVAVPEPKPESTPDEEASDLGSPGFHPQSADTSAFPGASYDLYQPATVGLSYPQGVPDEMSTGMDYSTYSTSAVQQHATPSDISYPHQSQQTSSVNYSDSLSATPPLVPAPEPAQPAPTTSSHPVPRRSLPHGAGHPHNRLSNPTNTDRTSGWQSENPPASNDYTYAGSPTRQPRSRSTANAPVYETPSHEGLQAAATLSQAALQKAHPSPSARTVSPFQNPTQAAQAARAKSRQGQISHSRAMTSPFQQTSTKQPAAADTAAIYNQPTGPDANNLANFEQYSRYSTATTQSGQASSRRAYEPYPQQTTSGNSSTSYPSYNAYNARSQASTSQSPAAPATQPMSTSYTRTDASSSTNWSSSVNNRNGTYGTNNAATTSNSGYSIPAASGQQQPAPAQSFNVRPQSTAHTSRKNTPSSYATQQHPQQPQRQQQPYNAYSSQSHSNSNHHQQQQSQPQSQQQNQQEWYDFNTSNNANPAYRSNSRGAGYGQPASATGSYGQHRAMNLSGNTYVNDQELYEMLRNNTGQ